ncbi:hypothetical protein K1719_017224 [Acacia pycnantha]|nr:hypothetical protein K1719_017224 [Acacia pycnantha]
MNTSYSLSILLFLHLLLLPLHIAFANIATSYLPLENIALNCGSNSLEPVSYNERIWTGDAGSAHVTSNDAETNKPLMAKATVINHLFLMFHI